MENRRITRSLSKGLEHVNLNAVGARVAASPSFRNGTDSASRARTQCDGSSQSSPASGSQDRPRRRESRGSRLSECHVCEDRDSRSRASSRANSGSSRSSSATTSYNEEETACRTRSGSSSQTQWHHGASEDESSESSSFTHPPPPIQCRATMAPRAPRIQ